MKNRFLACISIVLWCFGASADDLDTQLYGARKGMSSAMNQLGIMYYTGHGGAQRDFSAAYYWWKEGALKQNPKAIANLGVCYQFGRGVARDSVEAMRLYMTAIADGQTELLRQRSANVSTNAFDAVLTGLCLQRGVGGTFDPVKAAESFASAAAMGSVDGMREAGFSYLLLADGKPYYESNALEWFKRAADRGDAVSARMAGKILLGQYGMAPDKVQAKGYLRRAAEGGDVEAQGLLGKLIYEGSVNRSDRKTAMQLMREAAQGGSGEAMWHYGGALLTEDCDEGLFWLSQAAQAGYADEFRAFANTLAEGDPVRDYMEGVRAAAVYGDAATAIDYFRRAEKGGSKEAGAMAAYLQVVNGENVKKAVKQLQKLAPANPLAATLLARLNFEGVGVKKNLTKGVSLLRTAANDGYAPAMDALAGMYYDGFGVDADRRQAIGLYERAYAARRLSAEGRDRLIEYYSGAGDTAKADAVAAYAPTRDSVKRLLAD